MRKLQLTKEISPEIIKAKIKASLTFSDYKRQQIFYKGCILCYPEQIEEYYHYSREFITLIVYDITGREVNALANGSQSARYYEISFDTSDLPGGVYFYSLSSEGFTNTKRKVLIK